VLPVAKLCHGEWSTVLIDLYQLIYLRFHLFYQFCFQLLSFHAPYSLPLLVNVLLPTRTARLLYLLLVPVRYTCRRSLNKSEGSP